MSQKPRAIIELQTLEDRTNPSPQFVPGQVLVGFTPGQEQQGLTSVSDHAVVSASQPIGFGIYKLTLQPSASVEGAISTLSGRAGVAYVQPDYIVKIAAAPNDPSYQDGTKWDLHNTGQNGATPGIDINAEPGWDIGSGTGDHIVAVIDTGVDYTHPDLAANMWTDPATGTHGFDFVNNDSDPMDDQGHGTNVAGIIGAVGDNGIGTVGVAWKTRLMAVKVLGANGSGPTSGIISGMQFAVSHGATILNESLGGTGLDPAELQAAQGVRAAGAILVVAAGNDSQDNDVNPHYPANFGLDNMVSVAAVDWTGHLSFFSDYGLKTVNIGAPGGAAESISPLDGIYSTAPGGGYGFESGTSQATPHVAGAIADFWDANPSMTYLEVIQHLYSTVRLMPDLMGKTTTGGMLDLGAFMESGGTGVFATGADAGGGPHVKVYGGFGKLLASFFAYDQKFTGGVRVAVGDVNGDKTPDIITVAGPGGGPHVKVFDGKTFQEIYSFYAFEPTFSGGLTVSTGDVNGDGRADIIVGADKGGGPRVSVFSLPIGGTTLSRIADFYAYAPNFNGGVRVAAGSFTANSKQQDIVTAPGVGGGPDVRRFNAASVLAYRPAIAAETMVGDPNSRTGLYVAAGDMNGDGLADIVTGSGSGTPIVTILDGKTMAPIIGLRSPVGGEIPGLVNPGSSTSVGTTYLPVLDSGLLPPAAPPDSLIPTNTNVKPATTYGVRVAIMDANGDKRPDLIVAGGSGDAPTVSIINGVTLNPMRIFSAYAPSFFGGVFVGAPGV